MYTTREEACRIKIYLVFEVVKSTLRRTAEFLFRLKPPDVTQGHYSPKKSPNLSTANFL